MQLIDRTLETLVILSNFRDGLSLAELSENLGIPKSSTHRILQALKENKFIYQMQDSKKYTLGYKLLTLSKNLSKENHLTLAAKPFMREIALKLNKTVTLNVMESNYVITIYYVESKDTPMFMVRIGHPMPPHVTSAGKVFLAFQEPDIVREIFSMYSSQVFTKNTITDFNQFMQELNLVKKQGYCISNEELQIGVQGIASPIFDYTGRVVASVALTAFKTDDVLNEEHTRILKYCANQITDAIGGNIKI